MAVRMTPVEKQKLFFFTDKPSEIVLFKFKRRKEHVRIHKSVLVDSSLFFSRKEHVRIHKSVLVDSSLFFKDMYENVTNTDPLEPILIGECTEFNRVDGFLAYAEALYETNPMVAVTQSSYNDWFGPTNRILQVYHSIQSWLSRSLVTMTGLDQPTESFKFTILPTSIKLIG